MRPSRHASPAPSPRTSIQLVDLLSILDRRPIGSQTFAVCHCATCTSLRKPVICRACGYHGSPIVRPCSCEEKHMERWLAISWGRIREMNDAGTSILTEKHGNTAHVTQYHRSDVMRWIGQLTEGLAAVRDGKPCTPHQSELHSDDLTGADDGCLHGTIECPVCDLHPRRGDAEDWDIEDIVGRLWDIRLLIARGGPRP